MGRRCLGAAGAEKRACGEREQGASPLLSVPGAHPAPASRPGVVAVCRNFCLRASEFIWQFLLPLGTSVPEASWREQGDGELVTQLHTQTAAGCSLDFPARAPDCFSVFVRENLSQGSTFF